MPRSNRLASFLLPLGLGAWLLFSNGAYGQTDAPKKPLSKKSAGESTVLATVDGENLTQGDLDRMFRLHQVTADRRTREREAMVEKLIDRILIRRHLAKLKIAPSKGVVDAQLRALVRRDGGNGKQSEEILAKHGYPPAIVRDELEFRLAWREYVEQFQEGKGVREYFEEHHEWFDGTEVHARQIVKKVAGDDESARVTAETQLRQIRSKIVAGELEFESAAKQHSDAPSRDEGGDVGWFPFRGKMPPEISQVAFALADGEISEPFRSPFGAHLVQVVERKAGELNLEDVREQVLSDFSESHWRSTADDLRKSATIQREPLPSKKK